MRGNVVILVVFLLSVRAVPLAGADCSDFKKAIDTSLKLIATSRAEAIGDNSAPRATLRAAEIANELQLISINLSLMSNNRCTLPAEPVRTGKYLLNALKCSTERLKGVVDSPACDYDKWVPGGEKEQSQKHSDSN